MAKQNDKAKLYELLKNYKMNKKYIQNLKNDT